MARRRRRKNDGHAGWLVIAALAVVLIALAVEYWYVTLAILAAVGGAFYWRRDRRKREARRFEREWEADWAADLASWRDLTFKPGPYSVTVSGFVEPGDEHLVWELLCNVPVLRDRSEHDLDDLIDRVLHISPQVVADGITQHHAIRLKMALERRGAKVKIKEDAARPSFGNRRGPIPTTVRREVWRRDVGRCVDCGSRERLEYDHIIAVANGGSNTARNIELRCQTCNRKKGATV